MAADTDNINKGLLAAYHDQLMKTEITKKQDKLVSGTNIKTVNNQSILGPGNLNVGGSHVQSDWNQSDNTQPDYIKNKPTIPDVSGKADKNEMSVTPGTGANADKTTIQLKSGTSATVLTQHQDVSGKANASDVYTKSQTYTKTEVNGLVDTPHQNYVTVSTYASLPASGSADTIYRVSNYDGSTSQVDVTKYSEYAWDGSAYVFLCVKSQIGEMFDISVYNNNATYADLAAALGADGANVPADIRRGGMSVKFVQSSDNKYVQFRYMSSSTTVADFTNVDNWQGVDDVPTLGSNNMVKSSGVYQYVGEKLNPLEEEIYGVIDKIEVPYEDFYEGYYVGRSSLPQESGMYVNLASNKCTVVEIPEALRGKHISTTNNIFQYGFCKAYTERVSVTYCDGTDRVTTTAPNTKIDNVVVPEDCKYLYLYIATSTVGVTVTNNDAEEGKVGIKILAEEANAKADEAIGETAEIKKDIAPILPRLQEFTYAYTFNGTNTKAELRDKITLHENGDYLQFKVDSVGDINTLSNEQYSFSYGATNTSVAIGMSATMIYVRSSDGTWIALNQEITGGIEGKTIKISYEEGDIKIYADTTLVNTYTGQKDIVVGGFGWNSAYGYWEGGISNIVLNGNKYSINANASTTTLTEIPIGSVLSPSEQAALDNSNPSMMIEKSATEVGIYTRNSDGTYVKYPLKYRNIPYSASAYPAFLDNWGIDQVEECSLINGSMQRNHRLFMSGEAELAVQVPSGAEGGQPTYVGGAAHGFENIVTEGGAREIIMLLNGQQIAENAVLTLQPADKFEVFAHSLIYQAYTNSNPWGEVHKHWLFTADGVKIETKVKITRVLNIGMAQFGMLCVYRHIDGNTSSPYLTKYANENDNNYKVYNIADGWWTPADMSNPSYHVMTKQHDVSKVSLWGECNYGISIEASHTTLKPNGGMFIGTNGGQAYNKVYFDLTGAYTPEQDEELYATQTWYINKLKSE